MATSENARPSNPIEFSLYGGRAVNRRFGLGICKTATLQPLQSSFTTAASTNPANIVEYGTSSRYYWISYAHLYHVIVLALQS